MCLHLSSILLSTEDAVSKYYHQQPSLRCSRHSPPSIFKNPFTPSLSSKPINNHFLPATVVWTARNVQPSQGWVLPAGRLQTAVLGRAGPLLPPHAKAFRLLPSDLRGFGTQIRPRPCSHDPKTGGGERRPQLSRAKPLDKQAAPPQRPAAAGAGRAARRGRCPPSRSQVGLRSWGPRLWLPEGVGVAARAAISLVTIHQAEWERGRDWRQKTERNQGARGIKKARKGRGKGGEDDGSEEWGGRGG